MSQHIAKSYISLIYLHIALFLFGSAGVLGKALAVSAIILVSGRTFFAAITLGFFLRKRIYLKQSKSFLGIILCGVLLAAHWLLFFQAIIVSSVTIGLMGFATSPVFVTIFESIFFKEKLLLRDLLLTLLVIIGIWYVCSPEGWHGHITIGLLYGIGSGLLFASLILSNRFFIRNVGPAQITFWQNAIASLVLLPFIPWDMAFSLPASTWCGLLILGVIFTALSHTLFTLSLRNLRAHLVAVSTMLEPVYGVLLAALFLGEWPTLHVLTGVIIVLVATSWMTLEHQSSQY